MYIYAGPIGYDEETGNCYVNQKSVDAVLKWLAEEGAFRRRSIQAIGCDYPRLRCRWINRCYLTSESPTNDSWKSSSGNLLSLISSGVKLVYSGFLRG